ncbi:MAG: ribosome recycling factor [Clostridiales bacterium]
MIKDILNDAENRMNKVAETLRKEFSSLRAGRANPSLLDKVLVDYYGTPSPINQTANISCPEPRLILIQPWDKSLIGAIEKAILKSDLGLNPNNDGNVLRINIPQLTEDRRKELVKTCGKKEEEAKVAIRNIRRDVNDMIKEAEKAKEVSEDDAKRGLDNAQKLTDKFITKLDEILAQKEKEIMEV